MPAPSPKQLKKLADACRKAGIKSYKDADCEFTLTEDAPTKKVKQSHNLSSIAKSDAAFSSDTLEGDSLLFWSTGVGGVPMTQEEDSQ